VSFRDLYLLFEASGRSFGVPATAVREIIPRQSAGELLLIDLEEALAGAPARAVERMCAIVLHEGLQDSGQGIAIVADGVTDVVALEPGDLVAPPDFGPRVRLPWLAALARNNGSFSIVLDVRCLVAGAAAPVEVARSTPVEVA
jgi:chemotaxis signal transduction protein